MLSSTAVNSKRNRLRLAAAIAIPALTIAGLVGCSSSPKPSSSSTALPHVNLKYSFLAATALAGETNVSPYQTLAQEFSKSHPNITFTFDPIISENYGQVVRTQIAAGNAADVIYLNSGSGDTESLIPFASAGYLAPLTGQPGAKLATKFGAKLFSANGVVYGQPVDIEPSEVNIDQTAYASLNIKVPTTLDQVYAACATAKAAGKSLFVFAGGSSLNPSLAALQIAATDVYSSDPKWDDQKTAGVASFATSAGWKKTLQTVVDMNSKGCFQPGATAAGVFANTPTVASGKAMSAFQFASSLTELAAANKAHKFGAIAFPASNNPSATRMIITPTDALAVNAKTTGATKAAALEFLAWMAQKKNADQFATLSDQISVQASGGGLNPALAGISKYITNPKLALASPQQTWPNSQIYADLGTGIQGLLTGQTTIPKVLASLDAAWG
jgi:raffinose/stachyose/melibiose transport system substrate-binding protein